MYFIEAAAISEGAAATALSHKSFTFVPAGKVPRGAAVGQDAGAVSCTVE